MLSALVLGTAFCAGIWVSDARPDLTHHQLSLRLQRAEASESQSQPTVQCPDCQEQNNAGVPAFGCLPCRTCITIRRCSTCRIQILAEVFAENPDQLIELPGTPPPLVV